ncbi:uncharacterized protein LOC123529730 isoform X2 [Mercenaria mercenaria]|uniref:uncharacterized protein LOC123529730 isoform X2 n=1 Tax=Mercenaria mercenaria TaxID=6596 RepID=UPI00234F1408|nr:uncharacterized protein LOC123529730 isoform X2 [Mercenaria mercenaria]
MGLIFEYLAILTASICLVYAVDKPCCFSKRFIANMTIVTATIRTSSSDPTFTENRLHVDYDKDRRRERTYGYIIEGAGLNQTKIKYNVWNDYTSGKRYGYTNNAPTCSVSPLDRDQFDHCVPDTLRLVATYIIGSENGAVRVNSWEGTSDNFQYTYVTSVDNCTPISFIRYGETADGTRLMENTLFSDVTQYKVSSDDALDIPQACLTADVANVGK